MIRRLYPKGKRKAFNLTYDDGVLQDVRFVSLLDRYGLKGTFNLNSALLENEFEWVHESGCTVKRLSAEAAASLYSGHEVASHSLTHPYMAGLSKEEIIYELREDKARLEALFGTEIKGFAVPFDYYSETIEQCVKACGFEYARISEESGSFAPQRDFHKWRATVFHCCDGLEELACRFAESDEELALFQIVGHSYDLDTENKWEQMESIFGYIASRGDILPMTTIELITYLKAMDKAEICDGYIRNGSDISLWFEVNNTPCEAKAYSEYKLND